MLQISLPGLHGAKGTTDFSVFEYAARRTKEKQVACLSLPALLTSEGMQHVGYMTVDVEGGELPFLAHFDFAAFQVDVLQVECNTLALCADTTALVQARGFVLMHKHAFRRGPRPPAQTSRSSSCALETSKTTRRTHAF